MADQPVDCETEMDQEIEEKKKEKPVESNVLHSFTKLTSNTEKKRVTAGITLLKSLVKNDSEKEYNYTLVRLIRGVGSTSLNAKSGFYSALVALLCSSDISIEKVFDCVKKHLSTSGSKSEYADVCMGQILVAGALIRSKLYFKGISDEQKVIIDMLITAGKKRSYLSMASYSFLVELLNECDESHFQEFVWPIVKEEVLKQWKEQTLDTIYYLSVARDKYPSILKSKHLNKHLNSPNVIHEDSMEYLCNLLLNVPLIATLKHPIYPYINKKLIEQNLISQFCKEADKHLLNATRNKYLITIEMYSHFLQNMSDYSKIPCLFTDSFVIVMLSTFKNTNMKDKSDEFLIKTNNFFEILTKTIQKENVTNEVKSSVLKKLLFYPGEFNFEQITHSKLIKNISSSLDEEGVKKLANQYKEIVLASKPKVIEENKTSHWYNTERIYAAELLTKLLSHKAVVKDINWRKDQLEFLLQYGLFKDTKMSVGSELSASIRECFYRSLDQKFSKISELQEVLKYLVDYIDKRLTTENILCQPLSDESSAAWKDAINFMRSFEKTSVNQNDGLVTSVFCTLVLNMALQLFSHSDLAISSLKELKNCFDRFTKDEKSKCMNDTNEEPEWLEVVIDLFLSLLSQDSHLFRTIITRVFPYLCPLLTLSTLHQILAVLDPKNENPLSKKSNSDEENSDDSEESEKDSDDDESNADDDESNADDEENDDNNDENDEIGDASTTDRLRTAVREALHQNGLQTDDDSEDMDAMDEETGRKLDEALANAFKEIRKSKPNKKKQAKDDKILTHFRARVLDLIEIYIDSEPSMLNCLEIIVSLLQALEFSIRDFHQKPIETRIRVCLKKLSAIKKFDNFEGVTKKLLMDLMTSFLEKGSRTSFVYLDMNEKLAECCIFIIRCSQLLAAQSTKKKNKFKSLEEIIEHSLKTFFDERDCLLSISLFKKVLNLTWSGNWLLIPLLVNFAFNNDVRPFRRNQALELLRIFYLNNRFRTIDDYETKIIPIEKNLSEKSLILFKNLISKPKESKIKEKFISNLLELLVFVKNTKSTNVDWEALGNSVCEYRSVVSLGTNAKSAYSKFCRIVGISNVVKMKNAPKINEHDSDSESTPKVNEQDSDSENEQDENQLSNKLEENNSSKKKRKNRTSKGKLKKEAALLRIKASSEGLDSENFHFSDVHLNGVQEEEEITNSNGTDDSNIIKKRRNSESNDIKKKKKIRKSK